MTHLTPSELDVFLKPNLGIRNMSDAIARKVSKTVTYIAIAR
jgi:hypothetical protein